MNKKTLVFDIWANYGHYKVIYATTSALTYPIPFKTAIYGLIGNIIGLKKEQNQYLNRFNPGACKIALQIMHPVKTQRIHINLSPAPGPIKDNRKPTLMEHVYNPRYRIYFTHNDEDIYERLKSQLMKHQSVYTPCMGLANLLANFCFVGEFEYQEKEQGKTQVQSIIPMQVFLRFGEDNANTEIIQLGMYAMEMNANRDVTKRDDILLERTGKAIHAEVKNYQSVDINDNVTHIILM